jgi:hypothetical protein
LPGPANPNRYEDSSAWFVLPIRSTHHSTHINNRCNPYMRVTFNRLSDSASSGSAGVCDEAPEGKDYQPAGFCQISTSRCPSCKITRRSWSAL